MANKAAAARLAPAPDAADDDSAPDEVDLNDATVTLTWNGQEFTVPKRRGRWPVVSVREFNRGNNIEGLISVLGGQDAWVRIQAICPIADDLNEFIAYATRTVNEECVP